MKFEWDWEYTFEILPILGEASLITIQATLLGFLIAATLGLGFAVARMYGPSSLQNVTGFLVEAIRSTPLLVQIFFVYYVLPNFGIALEAMTAGILALGVHYACYCSEVYRAGIQAVPKGQWEACTALNMGLRDKFIRIILPQAIPPIIPMLGNYLIGLFKETPLLSAIAILELMQMAKILGSESFQYTEPVTLVGVFFLVFSMISALLVKYVEHTLNQARWRVR